MPCLSCSWFTAAGLDMSSKSSWALSTTAFWAEDRVWDDIFLIVTRRFLCWTNADMKVLLANLDDPRAQRKEWREQRRRVIVCSSWSMSTASKKVFRSQRWRYLCITLIRTTSCIFGLAPSTNLNNIQNLKWVVETSVSSLAGYQNTNHCEFLPWYAGR